MIYSHFFPMKRIFSWMVSENFQAKAKYYKRFTSLSSTCIPIWPPPSCLHVYMCSSILTEYHDEDLINSHLKFRKHLFINPLSTSSKIFIYLNIGYIRPLDFAPVPIFHWDANLPTYCVGHPCCELTSPKDECFQDAREQSYIPHPPKRCFACMSFMQEVLLNRWCLS